MGKKMASQQARGNLTTPARRSARNKKSSGTKTTPMRSPAAEASTRSSKPRISGANTRKSNPPPPLDEGAAPSTPVQESGRRESIKTPGPMDRSTIVSPVPANKADSPSRRRAKESDGLDYKPWSGDTEVPVIADMLTRLSRNPCSNEDPDDTTCKCETPCRTEDFYAMRELTGEAYTVYPTDKTTGKKKPEKKPAKTAKITTVPERVKKHLAHEHKSRSTLDSLRSSSSLGVVGVAVVAVGVAVGVQFGVQFGEQFGEQYGVPFGVAVCAAVCAAVYRFFNSDWIKNWSPNLGALRNSPHVDVQSDTESVKHGWYALGHRHPPGPREFFRMHGSHSSFVDAVGMDVKMLELIDVDEDLGAFEIKLELTVSWYDKTFDTEQWDPAKGNMGNNIKVTSYCAPKITIKDVLEGDDGWENHKNVSEVNLCWKEEDELSPGLKGVVFKTMELTCKIRDDNPIENLPFDQQELTVEFEMPESASRDAKDHNRYFVPLNVGVDTSHDHMTWNNHRAVAHVTKPIGEKQHLVCVYRVTRQPTNYVINIIFILFTTALLSGLSFVISLKEVADRSSVTLTLLLTVVAFKLLLADTLPKVSYLTYLDWYTMFCFSVIFLIAFENFAIAFLTGIEYTPSCGREVNASSIKDALDLPSGNSTDVSEYLSVIFKQLKSMEDKDGEDTTDCKVPHEDGSDVLPHKDTILELYSVRGGSYWYKDAIAIEAEFQKWTALIFLVGHVYFFLRGVYHLFDRTWKCGTAVTRNVQKEAEEYFEEFVTEKKQEPVQKQKDLIAVKRCPCVPCFTRQPETDKLEVLEENMSNEEKQVYAAITNAGLGLTLRNLVPALIDAGLNVQRMKDLDEVLLAQLLGDLQVKAEDRIELMMSARDQVDVMFLQGSASYLFLDLSLAGKLVTKAVCLEKIDARFSKAKNKDPLAFVSLSDKDGKNMDHLDHDLKSLANMLYGYLLMNSSATPTMAFLSKRECQSAEGPIYSQLWAGFAAHRATQLEDGVDQSKIVVVDLGSGEFKRFFCKLERGKAVEKVEEAKDTDTPKLYKAGMEKLFDDLQKYYSGELKAKKKIVDADPALYEVALAEVVNAILGNGTVEAFIAKHGGVDGVYFLATSSTRKFFSVGSTGSDNDAHGATFAKIAIIRIIAQKLKEQLGGNNTLVDYKLLLQKDEAKYEFSAARAAIDYAIDIPLQAQGVHSFAALAWGNGSCQGYNCGDIEAPAFGSSTKKKQMLSLEVGLGEVQKQIQKQVDTVIEDKGDITGKEHFVEEWWDEEQDKDGYLSNAIIYKKKDKKGKSGTRIRFRDDDAIDRLRLLVGKELKTMIQKKSTTPIKFFQTVFELKSAVL